MKRSTWFALTGAVMLCVITLCAALADPFPDRVASVEYGNLAGFGQDHFPDIVLGPPEGAGAAAGSADVLSLGDGGVIVLEFTEGLIVNEPGPDFTIFENAFYVSGDPLNVYAEVAKVAVSADGVDFVQFPCDYDPAGEPLNNPNHWHGFAGVNPVYSNSENGIDPTDPTVSGGDQFDLDAVGLEAIRFIKIMDTNEGADAMQDDNGDVIYDPGVPMYAKSGFDLDAAAAIHWLPFSPTAAPTEPPTVTPPSTPVETPTAIASATPARSPTPPATPTPNATPPPALTQTPTPPPAFETQLILNQDRFTHGDELLLQLLLENPNREREVQVFIVLDVSGNYWFWPQWSQILGYGVRKLPPAQSQLETILDFVWPAGAGKADSLRFWGAMVEPLTGSVLGNVAEREFGFY